MENKKKAVEELLPVIMDIKEPLKRQYWLIMLSVMIDVDYQVITRLVFDLPATSANRCEWA